VLQSSDFSSSTDYEENTLNYCNGFFSLGFFDDWPEIYDWCRYWVVTPFYHLEFLRVIQATGFWCLSFEAVRIVRFFIIIWFWSDRITGFTYPLACSWFIWLVLVQRIIPKFSEVADFVFISDWGPLVSYFCSSPLFWSPSSWSLMLFTQLAPSSFLLLRFCFLLQPCTAPYWLCTAQLFFIPQSSEPIFRI
jgi:hypothetical protein